VLRSVLSAYENRAYVHAHIHFYTTINFTRLSVTVGMAGLGVLGVVDTRFGVSEPAADAEW